MTMRLSDQVRDEGRDSDTFFDTLDDIMTYLDMCHRPPNFRGIFPMDCVPLAAACPTMLMDGSVMEDASSV